MIVAGASSFSSLSSPSSSSLSSASHPMSPVAMVSVAAGSAVLLALIALVARVSYKRKKEHDWEVALWQRSESEARVQKESHDDNREKVLHPG
jgi:phage protein D